MTTVIQCNICKTKRRSAKCASPRKYAGASPQKDRPPQIQTRRGTAGLQEALRRSLAVAVVILFFEQRFYERIRRPHHKNYAYYEKRIKVDGLPGKIVVNGNACQNKPAHELQNGGNEFVYVEFLQFFTSAQFYHGRRILSNALSLNNCKFMHRLLN